MHCFFAVPQVVDLTPQVVLVVLDLEVAHLGGNYLCRLMELSIRLELSRYGL